jgi:hypothetical protein
MMKAYGSLATVFFLAVLVTNAEAARYPRDFSGDAMQGYNSRMPSSPMTRFPALLGTSYWPFVPYLPAPSMTITNIVVEVPEAAPPPSPAKPPAASKFWFARCGVFIGMDVGSTTNLMEEEGKPCAR